MRTFRKLLFIALALLAVLLIYIPIRYFAQEYNTVTIGYLGPSGEVSLSDNYAYWFAMLTWPIYSVVAGFLPLFVTFRIDCRWYLIVLVLILAPVVWQGSSLLDDVLGIPGGGLSGFQSFPINQPGWSTPKVSFTAAPIAFLIGILAGIVGGVLSNRRSALARGA